MLLSAVHERVSLRYLSRYMGSDALEIKKKKNTRKSLRSGWEDRVFDSTDGFRSLIKSCRCVVSYFSIHFASEMTFLYNVVCICFL